MLKNILKSPVTRWTAGYLVLFFAGAFAFPVVAEAAFISSSKTHLKGVSPDTIAQVQAALEDEYIAEHLSSLGLSASEIQERLSNLTVEERESIVSRIDSLQAGGNSIVGLLIICVLVFFVLKMTDKI